MTDPYQPDLFGESSAPPATGVVAEQFIFPPFTILDARSGPWQERKRAWLALGIKGEVGRDDKLLMGNVAEYLGDTGAVEARTSIFDPTMCELAYRWFAPPAGQVVDPFAGGSVRGILAAWLGRRYWGGDLRAEHVDANREQATKILDRFAPPHTPPVWTCGDSAVTIADAPPADMIFTCPPYGDLERYSDHPADLSAMEWPAFVAAYRRIIAAAVARLKPDRFACFVVGDFRCGRGFYRDFVSTTIRAHEDAGARLYNEAILATAIGTASARVTAQFEASRKMAKTHQNVLVFCKGDPKRAAAACKGGVP